jgi:hypothetical protein
LQTLISVIKFLNERKIFCDAAIMEKMGCAPVLMSRASPLPTGSPLPDGRGSSFPKNRDRQGAGSYGIELAASAVAQKWQRRGIEAYEPVLGRLVLGAPL